ncbi:MAG: LptF/LptG family permease [Campylobacter sp.]|nr:LptF/LptG family permease [Campylobacter sp.]
MKVFFYFVSRIYLKNFFIIFTALLVFYCGIDLLVNFKKLPDSANLDLLYTLFLAFSAVKYVLPLSLVFALVYSLITMIRNNELISLYALGLSKNLVILYPFLWALFFCFVYVGLNFTSFAYADDYKRNVRKNGSIGKQSGEVFLKFNDSFAYVGKLQSGSNSVQEVKIFNIKDFDLDSYIVAKEAFFKDNAWNLKDGNLTKLPKEYSLGKDGLEIKEFDILGGLEGFEPKVIEGIASNSDYTIQDAFISLMLFKAQNVSTTAVRTSLYKLIFTPFFAPFLMLIIYYFFPAISRFFNLSLVVFIALVSTMLIWGVLFLLTRLSENAVILSEVGTIMPIIILALLGGFMFYKHR